MSTLGSIVLAVFVSQSPPLVYADIRDGEGFPGQQEALDDYSRDLYPTRMRHHVWNVFRLLTEPSKSGPPVWMTWYGREDVFSDRSPVDEHPSVFVFETVSQLVHLDEKAIARSMLSRVLYNRFILQHIQDRKLVEPRDDLIKLLQGAGGRDRTLQEALRRENELVGGTLPIDFDRRAVVLKTVWWPIKQDGYTALPVWDGVGYGAEPSYRVEKWPRLVAVSAYQADIVPGQVRNVELDGKVHPAGIVSISRFYSIQICNNEDAARLNRSEFSGLMHSALGRKVQVGDHAVLVAMHMTTKELPNWIWATFWWHDKPDEGPYADERPVSLTGVWRNYLMNQVTQSADEVDQRINYNPWLEAPMQNGARSNCIACHERAGWYIDQPEAAPLRGLWDSELPNHFHNTLQTGFLWSVANLKPRETR